MFLDILYRNCPHKLKRFFVKNFVKIVMTAPIVDSSIYNFTLIILSVVCESGENESYASDLPEAKLSMKSISMTMLKASYWHLFMPWFWHLLVSKPKDLTVVMISCG